MNRILIAALIGSLLAWALLLWGALSIINAIRLEFAA